MKKHTLGEHYDAWTAFLKWYWKYTIKPRFLNPFRKLRYYLWGRKAHLQNRSAWLGRGIFDRSFYGEGMMPDEKGMALNITEYGKRSHIRPATFKQWWRENAGFESREGNQRKREALKKHIAELRKLIKKI